MKLAVFGDEDMLSVKQCNDLLSLSLDDHATPKVKQHYIPS